MPTSLGGGYKITVPPGLMVTVTIVKLVAGHYNRYIHCGGEQFPFMELVLKKSPESEGNIMKTCKKHSFRLGRCILAGMLAAGLFLFPAFRTGDVQALPPGSAGGIFTVAASGPLADLPSGGILGSYIVNGVCPDLAGPLIGIGCTLREAVDEANAVAAPLVPPAYVLVTFAAPFPIELYYGPLVVRSNVVIRKVLPGEVH